VSFVSTVRPARRRLGSVLVVAVVIGGLLGTFGGARVGNAAAILSISPITWDVIGLDHNDPTDGPDTFPVGARVCNTGSDPATNVAGWRALAAWLATPQAAAIERVMAILTERDRATVDLMRRDARRARSQP